ncbi:MAG TPA: SDR family oxidoreductase [Candidatus Paceibacterota bacterium]|nr:SDR family oxidoreductase [Candidatus Paceibacterota bacterium]
MCVNTPKSEISAYDRLRSELLFAPRIWLITGAAGFIGSNLLEVLLGLGQRVVGLDNFATGKQENLDEVRSRVSQSQWECFRFIQGDITEIETCRRACQGVDVVLHHAALVSVPLSMADPVKCHQSNVTGFMNMLVAARDAAVKRFVYASSSAVYGDDPLLPKVEDSPGRALSPYAATKAMNETYADLFARIYGLQVIGLRYFNVFGSRQDPAGGYAAVIPMWIAALLKRETVFINGDGTTTRDFCHVGDVVQANLLAGTVENPRALNQVFNIALGRKTTLNELFQLLKGILAQQNPSVSNQEPVYRDFRPGDVRHSVADIRKATELLGFSPRHGIKEGLELAVAWYRGHVVNLGD